jgi:hypothetical protein
VENQDSKWLRFTIENLATKHFMRTPFPPFTIRLVTLSGADVPHPMDSQGNIQALADIPISVTVHNKWVDVTSEVIPDCKQLYTLKNGSVTIGDWIFHETSLIHGEYFTIHIDPLDFVQEINGFESPRVIILSAKYRVREQASRAPRARRTTTPQDNYQ